MSRTSSDRASLMRKRALRRLARQEYHAYRKHHAVFTAQGYAKDQARGRAWTQLRRQFPDAYLELYALEQVEPGYDTSPQIRARSWQQAMGLLGDLRKTSYREHLRRFLAEGLSNADAAYRASAAIRSQDPELFARLLAAEIRMWQSLSGSVPEAAEPEPGTPVPVDAATARGNFSAAVRSLERTAARASGEPGRDPALLYAVLAERITDLAASVQKDRIPGRPRARNQPHQPGLEPE